VAIKEYSPGTTFPGRTIGRISAYRFWRGLMQRVQSDTRLQRRLFLIATLASCVATLTACAGISTDELDKLGSTVAPANIDFTDIYAYAERSNAAYEDKLAIKLKYPLTIRINSPDGTEVRYFLERDDKTHTQFITVRGTHNNKNLAEDLDITVREDRKVDIPVHAGFDAAARAVFNDLKSHLKPGYKTYVTGHSLGGAVAAILAIYLIEDGVQVERVVTVGQPRFTTTDGEVRILAVDAYRR
jgi:triacylglycerol lipase